MGLTGHTQRNWANHIYPFLERMDWVDCINDILVSLSAPFHPWISWHIDAVKFPINSYEIYFIAMFLSITGYVVGSLLTYKPYNLDKLLHRGAYSEGNELPKEKWTFRSCFSKI